MKHDLITTPSTQNVLKMLFECKTFDEQSKPKETRNLEAVIELKEEKFEFVGYSRGSITPLLI